ncbi:hypothetical protein [Ruixingdingia sedimenti]|uniref:Uncharacterized protein n=1 Tax=Ruixingdingia sedimenti TaxID=3073604 RepID=A0ABU1FE71_9RHOB|nr:hypothetical protein [Xinfangfangia sp. LG-4]MDR5655176.1 hypothetical protein [Xinfangfangia sp. LG-4]
MDFSSWQGALVTVLGIAVVALVGVGIRVLMLLTIQQRQQRANRQINERLRTLIAAYKVLGGSFTGELLVDPSHLRDLRQRAEAAEGQAAAEGSDRARRIRDAVEAALSDIILLGTEEQVRLAARAAADMAAGQPIQTGELVVSLRDFIRAALDLDPVPKGVQIPLQGPLRQQSGSSRGSSSRSGGGTGGGGGMGGMGGGGGMGMGMGLGLGRRGDDG